MESHRREERAHEDAQQQDPAAARAAGTRAVTARAESHKRGERAHEEGQHQGRVPKRWEGRRMAARAALSGEAAGKELVAESGVEGRRDKCNFGEGDGEC